MSSSPSSSSSSTRSRTDESSQQDVAFLQSHEESALHSMLTGVAAGATCVIVGYPLDSIKVRLQSGRGMMGRGSSTQQYHNYRMFVSSLFRGIAAPLTGVLPSWAVSFTLYGLALQQLGSNDLGAVAIAGATAGVGYAATLCPLEFVKVNCQVAAGSVGQVATGPRSGGGTSTSSTCASGALQNILKDHNCRGPMTTRATASFLIRRYGLLGMYRGFGVCLLRDLGQCTAYYTLAEYWNRRLTEPLGPVLAPFVAGAITGVGHCSIEYPFDCIKTQRQVVLASGSPTARMIREKSYAEILQTIKSDAALRAQIRTGYLVTISRAVVAHGASFAMLRQLQPFLEGF
ncbi:unnamed protein product [Amoebophrya sp. A25]|nr:unnamed protein product [Amoebophrya sp. A25]|eukprot:GSA25T00021095001.1